MVQCVYLGRPIIAMSKKTLLYFLLSFFFYQCTALSRTEDGHKNVFRTFGRR